MKIDFWCITHITQCTMWLSPLKSCIKEIKQNAFLCSHFLEISLFQTKYLENILYSVSLLIYIWGLVEHSQQHKQNLQWTKLQFKQSVGRMGIRFWDELNTANCKRRIYNRPSFNSSSLQEGCE